MYYTYFSPAFIYFLLAEVEVHCSFHDFVLDVCYYSTELFFFIYLFYSAGSVKCVLNLFSFNNCSISVKEISSPKFNFSKFVQLNPSI